ncbi:hypothetical protein Bhyg_06130 [Pseudolycoriella hygida]|uniref:Uncharacterized protein n=1 Tax=Pseudolycoriella hygida TaxID=35572 RepID=A0A9Q0N071_9DIPT|nr:hypothetical protein Bhyg_06130 [Pseudolycoriella hygida]
MFSTIVKTTSYTSGMVRNLLRAENHFVRAISTSNDVKNSDILTKNEAVKEAQSTKDIKKLKKRIEMINPGEGGIIQGTDLFASPGQSPYT